MIPIRNVNLPTTRAVRIPMHRISVIVIPLVTLLSACSQANPNEQSVAPDPPGSMEKEDRGSPHGLAASLFIEQKPGKNRVFFILEIKNISDRPRPFVPVYDFGVTMPGFAGGGTDTILRIKQLSGAFPKGFGMLHAPFHRPKPKVELLEPDETRQYRRDDLLREGRYKAWVDYKALSNVNFWGKPEYHVVSNTIEFEVAP